MSDLLEARKYTHPITGRVYRVEICVDHHIGPPDLAHDGHGIVVRPQEYPRLRRTEEDEMREALYRPLYNGVRYDFIGSIKLAIDDWGVSPEKAEEAVEQDYKYLLGYYRDDWCWCYVNVVLEDDDSFFNCVGGYESTILDDDKHYDEVIRDLVHEVEHQIRHDAHKDQMLLFA
jgi:hypothetical protein